MNRFIIFRGLAHYPLRGLNDALTNVNDEIIVFPNLEEALDTAQTLPEDWWQIVDLNTLKIVKSYEASWID